MCCEVNAAVALHALHDIVCFRINTILCAVTYLAGFELLQQGKPHSVFGGELESMLVFHGLQRNNIGT